MPGDGSTAVAKKQAKKLEVLKTERELVFTRVQRLYKAFQNISPDDVADFTPRYERLLTFEADFDHIQLAILELNSELVAPNQPLEVEQVQASFETLCYSAQTSYLVASRSVRREPSPSTSSVFNLSVNTLPVIEIPTFSGDISQWTEFHSLFKSLIDDNGSLSEIQKFHYLRSSLKGTALAVIPGFQLCAENHALAFQALVLRYQNKRLLANLYVQQVLEYTPLKSASHAGLQQFLNVHRNSIDALKALRLPELADFLLFSFALSNLDASTRRAFENKKSSDSPPTFSALLNFITEQSRTMELCGLDSKPIPSTKSKSVPPPKAINSLLAANQSLDHSPESSAQVSKSSSASWQFSCPVCKSSHSITRCPVFLNQSVDEKYQTLRQLQRCFNCMGLHQRAQCASKGSCRTRQSTRHHSLLHSAQVSTQAGSPSPDFPPLQGISPSPQSLACQVRTTEPLQQTVLLGTLRALIRDNVGQYQSFRAVIDSGSRVSAITHSLTQRLGLKIHPNHSLLSGIGHATARTYGTVQCSIASRITPLNPLQVQALVLSDISSHLPTSSIQTTVLERFRGLPMADDQFHIPDQVDFLIGADLYPNILRTNGGTVIRGSPSAINTMFGCVILGPVRSSEPASQAISLLTSLDRTLRMFWETEEVSSSPHVDPDDKRCEEHFIASHMRDSSGRYSVALPFKSSCSSLGSTRESSLQCYLSLERRLKCNPEHCVAYQEFMQDYLRSQHMQPARSPSQYVIPHHCVHKVTSSSTKLRVVFNASAPDPDGISLNQLLLSGSKLQRELPAILTSFRSHPIAICADIRQMYRQILIQPADRAYQHIFWRPHPHSPVVEYELNTVTYGLTPSAYLAQRVLHQVVQDEGAKFPLASEALKFHTYIDDVVSGASDLTQAVELQGQLQPLLGRGGFELRNWASNDPAALNALPAEHLETPLIFSTDDQGIKILGLLWDSRSDDFSFHTQIFEGAVTKRSVLSYIARIFDPLGFLTPFVCWMKIFMQQLWLSSVQWDDTLPETLTQCWLSSTADVSLFSQFRIPRVFQAGQGTIRLVRFCDASQKGYAAVLYLHTQSGCVPACVSLVRTKSKVAPVKTLTIPKLELSAARLLSRLLRATLPSLQSVAVDSVSLYTDSQIVLAWLATPPHRLRTFVANRVVEVLDNSSPSDWAHVPSDQNPADCASRGMIPSELMDHPLWLIGLNFYNLLVKSGPEPLSLSFPNTSSQR